MKKQHYAFMVCLYLVSQNIFSQTIISEERVAGIWTKAEAPYIITQDITVPSRNTLKVEAGVQIQFKPGIKMSIQGKLEASGSESDPISFSSENPDSTWNGLYFLDTDEDNYLKHTVIQSASDHWIRCKNSTLVINHSKLTNNHKIGIRAEGQSILKIINSDISANNSTYVILSTQSSNTSIINTFITDNSSSDSYGHVLSGTSRENNTMTIVNSTIANNQGGFGFNYLSEVFCVNSIIWGNGRMNSGNPKTTHIFYSNIEGGYEGTGNIDALPHFNNATTGDYTLKSYSPCKNTGHSDGLYNDWDGSRNDMGATGGSGLYILPEYDFGMAGIGQEKKRKFELINAREEPVNISSLNVSDQANFNLSLDHAVEVSPFSSLFFYVLFHPTTDGEINTVITINSPDLINATEGNVLLKGLGGIWTGEVSGIWEKSMSPIIIGQDVIVPINRSLVIRPGVEVLMIPESDAGRIQFTVEGLLKAEGSKEEPILFSSNHPIPAPGDWAGLVLNNETNTQIIFEHCIVEYATEGLTTFKEDLSIDNCVFRYCSSNGIFLQKGSKSSTNISNSIFQENGEWGMKILSISGCETSALVNPIIHNNIIEENHLGGIKIEARGRIGCNFCWCYVSRSSYCEPVLQNNLVQNNTGVGIKVIANGLTTSNFSRYATAKPIIERCIVTNNGGGISSEEQPDFSKSHASPSIYHCTFWNNGSETILVKDSSELIIQNSIIWGENAPGVVQLNGGSATIEYSNFSQLQVGEGNIAVDPLFRDVNNNDFRLMCTSPCINTGAPSSDADPDGTITDMGAFWFDQTFKISFTYETLAEDHCSGQTSVKFIPNVQTSEELNADSYSWNFSDGFQTLEEEPQRVFTESGSYDIFLKVSDLDCNIEKEIINQDLTFEVNKPPRIENRINYIAGEEDTPFSGLDLKTVFSDENDEDLDFQITSSNNLDMNITNGKFKFTPAHNWYGEEVITFFAIDGKGCEVTMPVRIEIQPVNDPPTIFTYNPVFTQFTLDQMTDQSFSFTAVDIDHELSELQYSWFIDNEQVFNGDDQFSYNFPTEGIHFIKGEVSDGEYMTNITWTITVNPVVDAHAIPQKGFGLNIYPNPFSTQTTIQLILDKKTNIQISIYDTQGKLVEFLTEDNLLEGRHIFEWKDNGISAGVYWLKVRTENSIIIRKMVRLE